MPVDIDQMDIEYNCIDQRVEAKAKGNGLKYMALIEEHGKQNLETPANIEMPVFYEIRSVGLDVRLQRPFRPYSGG